MQEDISKNICIFCSKDKRNSLGQDSSGDRRIKDEILGKKVQERVQKQNF